MAGYFPTLPGLLGLPPERALPVNRSDFAAETSWAGSVHGANASILLTISYHSDSDATAGAASVWSGPLV